MRDIDKMLCRFSQLGNPTIVKYLLDNGADVHAECDYALRWASYNGHVQVVKLLLERGADVHVLDDHALYWASYNGHTETVKVLEKHINRRKNNND